MAKEQKKNERPEWIEGQEGGMQKNGYKEGIDWME